jgi:hypothetical protein
MEYGDIPIVGVVDIHEVDGDTPIVGVVYIQDVWIILLQLEL